MINIVKYEVQYLYTCNQLEEEKKNELQFKVICLQHNLKKTSYMHIINPLVGKHTNLTKYFPCSCNFRWGTTGPLLCSGSAVFPRISGTVKNIN